MSTTGWRERRTETDRPPAVFRILSAAFLAGTLLLFCVKRTAGQDFISNHKHVTYSYEDGLPSYRFNGITQTGDAYLWLSSEDGVIRYDGTAFDVFDTSNTPSFTSNRIVEMVTGLREAIAFLSIDGSLVVHNAQRFTRIDSTATAAIAPVTAVAASSKGFLFSSTDALFLYDGAGARMLGELPPGISVSWIQAAADSTFWIGGNGVARFDGASVRVVAPPDSLTAEPLLAYSDHSDTLWTCSSSGIAVFAADFVREYPFGSGSPAMSRPPTNPKRFWRDDGGRFWIYGEAGFFVTSPNGLLGHVEPTRAEEVAPPAGSHVPRASTIFQTIRLAEWRPGLLSGSDPAWLAERDVHATVDHEGALWLAAAGDGLHYFKPALLTTLSIDDPLADQTVTAVAQDSTGVVWIATPNLLGRLAEGAFEPVAGLSGGVPQLYVDRQGTLWVYGFAGGFRVDNGRIRPYGFETGTPVLAMYETTDGTFWHLTRDGLYARRSGQRRRFVAENGFGGVPVRHITETTDGALWIAGQRVGVSRYKDGSFQAFTTNDGLSSAAVEHIYEDREGMLWISTHGGGINFMGLISSGLETSGRLIPRKVVHIRESDGLPSDVVHRIVEDNFGRFWMGSNQGVFYISRSALLAFVEGRSNRVNAVVFGESDGMSSRETNGGTSSGLRDALGRIWFATQNGVVNIDPGVLTDENLLPPVIIEGLSDGSRRIPAGRNAVELPKGMRSFQVDFTAVSFSNAERVRFEYLLDGFDRRWATVDRRFASYTQVPPGRFTFRVRATLGDYTRAGPSTILSVTVPPRFYETAWFRLVVLITGGLLVFGAVRFRFRRLLKRQRALEAKVQARTRDLEREKELTEQALEETRQNKRTIEEQARKLSELDQAKSRFFENISHEFRTPLSLISGPLEQMLSGEYGEVPASLRHQHKVMLKNSRRLLQLVNALMDLARLDAGRLRLDLHEHDLSEIIRSTFASFESAALQRSLKRSFRIHEGLRGVLDRGKIEVVLTNLIGNAVKYTPDGGGVGISARRDNGDAVIEIVDNGPGIPAEHLPHVFDRFYRVESTEQEDMGAGVGLALSKELVELHGGTLGVACPPSGGTRFTVRLPLSGKRTAGVTLPDPLEQISHPPVESRAREEAVSPNAQTQAPHERDTTGGADAADDKTTILVVEDNADLRSFIRSILEPDFRVIEAGDGKEGLATARSALPDLLIADLMMPRMDGNAMNRAISADPVLKGIPIIVLTAKSGPESEIEGYKSGADAYLTKPFDGRVLKAVVQSQLDSRKRLRERLGSEMEAQGTDTANISPFLENIYAAIDERLDDESLSPSALAEYANLSYSQFARRIKKETGLSPTRMLRNRRISRAVEMIEGKQGNMTEIAWAVGFKSLSYFARSFKEVMGTTPGAYRRWDSDDR